MIRKIIRKYKRKFYAYKKKILVSLAVIGLGTIVSVNGLQGAKGRIFSILGLDSVGTEAAAITEGLNIEKILDSSVNTEPVNNIPANGVMEVHYIDVGQGDSTLICCDGEYMLIDAGDNDKGTFIQNYLQKNNVDELKYLVLTHPDADHIGGADVVITKFNCQNVLMTDYKSDSNTYRDVIDAMSYRGNKATIPLVSNTYKLGEASFMIIAPNAKYDTPNNSSIGLVLQHGKNRFLFTGDAESEAENDILPNTISIKADVYQVGHHGSDSSSSEPFLDAVSPKFAVISCGIDNKYGHPHAGTLNNMRERGIQVFRTDEQGSIVAVSDGKDITWNCSPSETWKAGN